MPAHHYVLSIAGLDPCGGAGLLADIKTFEAHKVLGLGVCTAITYQNDVDFQGVSWLPWKELEAQLNALIERFPVTHVKIGLIENYQVLERLLGLLRTTLPQHTFIAWDPILKASAGFEFHEKPDEPQWTKLLQQLDLITPNADELKRLMPDLPLFEAAQTASRHCAVLLKGGHLDAEHSNDYLYLGEQVLVVEGNRIEAHKRGTGCVLSSAVLARLALGDVLPDAVASAKAYTLNYLNSSSTPLGFHYA